MVKITAVKVFTVQALHGQDQESKSNFVGQAEKPLDQ
jgi:hypothetical protein